ncbi:hypothetical protein [Arthrobacter sp. 2MCAF14]|uniref:hypothetical protein n=1 Tax=Arthrobacter sp. 2MCAF14 TaxID=3232982 RepID=UPI003F8FF101
MTETLTKPAVQRLPAANPKPWETCSGQDFETCPTKIPHIFIFHHEGVLYAGPACGTARLAPIVAGHLALAGVHIANPVSKDPRWAPIDGCVLLDSEQIELAIATLHEAGADVTLALSVAA